jgi:hypothetical protein
MGPLRSGLFSVAMTYGLNESPVGGQPPVQIQRVGGWKLTVGAMLAAAGLGFAGYVYLGPYRKLTNAVTVRAGELELERAATQDLTAERDKLKAEMVGRQATDQEKATAESKKQQAVDAFVNDLKTPLGAFGATLSGGGGRAEVSFAVKMLFEQPTSTVISAQGEAALKVLADAVKRAGLRTRVMAKLIPAPPPKDLAQFKNVGEFVMLRAVRVALALASGGVAPDRVAAAGEAPVLIAHKGKPVVPDRLEIEIEPE